LKDSLAYKIAICHTEMQSTIGSEKSKRTAWKSRSIAIVWGFLSQMQRLAMLAWPMLARLHLLRDSLDCSIAWSPRAVLIVGFPSRLMCAGVRGAAQGLPSDHCARNGAYQLH
jgi:hypothetical protein